MQKVARLEPELKEMRKEMKHHRKLHCSTLQPQLQKNNSKKKAMRAMNTKESIVKIIQHILSYIKMKHRFLLNDKLMTILVTYDCRKYQVFVFYQRRLFPLQCC